MTASHPQAVVRDYLIELERTHDKGDYITRVQHIVGALQAAERAQPAGGAAAPAANEAISV